MFERENEIRVEYKGFVGYYYVDYYRTVDDEMEFHNLEFYNNKGLCLVHATIGKAITKEELLNELKQFIDNRPEGDKQ